MKEKSFFFSRYYHSRSFSKEKIIMCHDLYQFTKILNIKKFYSLLVCPFISDDLSELVIFDVIIL